MIFKRRASLRHHPKVPEGLRVYAVGDVHGRDDLLARLLDMIEQDAAHSPAPSKIVIFLGDYIDRGPSSPAVLDRLIAGPSDHARQNGFSWITLRGNHENAILDFLADAKAGPMWLANGGLATISDYLGPIEPPKSPAEDWAGLERLRAVLAETIPPHHLAFLRSLPFCHVEGDYAFVHAGIRPGCPLDQQAPRDMMWIRGSFLDSQADHGKVIVHGHTITTAPDIQQNRIGIDTGAFATGSLTALALENDARAFLNT